MEAVVGGAVVDGVVVEAVEVEEAESAYVCLDKHNRQSFSSTKSRFHSSCTMS